MTRGQALFLILEQFLLLGTVGWFGMRFGKWTESRHKLTDSTNALVHELQMHRVASGIHAANHTATFIYDDREETA